MPVDHQHPTQAAPLHVAYLLKQYPRLSETFILNEILGLEAGGVDVSIFSLRHATEGRFHPTIARVRGTVTYLADPSKAAFLEAVRTLPSLRPDGVPNALAFLERLPTERRPRLLLNAIEIAGRAQEAGIDHLHAHFLTVAAHTAHLVHLLTGLPYTVTAHAKDIYRHSVDWEIAARVASHAASVVTVCDANLRYVAHRLDGTDVELVRIYNGIDPMDPPPSDVQRTPGLILGVGRLVEKKGFDLLIDAVALLAAERDDIRCVIVGDGDQRTTLEAQVRALDLDDRVTFTGPLSQHGVADWLARARVMAAPCRVGADGNQDALPTVLIEALGAGLPVVTTPVAGIPEIVTDGVEGLLVEAEAPQALAASLRRLLTEPDTWAAMAAAGPPKRRLRFERAQTVAQLIETFRAAQTSAEPTVGSAT